jgi:hypothetical protein
MTLPPLFSILRSRAIAKQARLVFRLALVLAGFGVAELNAGWPEIEFTADEIEYDGYHLHGASMRLSAAGQLHISVVETVGLPGFPGAGIELSGTIPRLDVASGSFRFEGGMQLEEVEIQLSSERSAEVLRVAAEIEGLHLAGLARLRALGEVAEWISSGRLDGRFSLENGPDNGYSVDWGLQLSGLSFDSPGGDYAAQGLELGIQGRLVNTDPLRFELEGSLQDGELLIGNFYRDFSDADLAFSSQPAWRKGSIYLEQLKVSDRTALNFEGSVRLPLEQAGQSWTMQVSRLELGFPAAYHRYLESGVAVWALDGLEMTGSVNWSGEWADGEFRSGDLDIVDLSVVDLHRNRFAITGLQGRLRPGDHAFESRLDWQGLLLGRFNLGQGTVFLDSEPETIALAQPLKLEVMGGQLDLAELSLRLPDTGEARDEEPDVRLRARLEDLDLEPLSQALGWPAFSGRASADIPAVRFDNGVLDVDGGIEVRVFDGLITMQDLRVERLFGVLPSLAANIELSGLDLEMLTQTFSFGRISGRLDGYVRDLRMLDWKPVAFDAWLGTPDEQQRKNEISRQAVNRLTTIGGGSATTALTSPLMRLFNRFSYRRLGLGCRLQNNICQVRGIAEDDVSVLLLEGAGVPKVTIRAFNRQVDWPQMVANLQAVSAEDPKENRN